eukprot:2944010-Ditylum_brightwellii.AAC.1
MGPTEDEAKIPTSSDDIRVAAEARAAEHFCGVKSSCTGREGAQWVDVIEGDGSGPGTAWDDRYPIAYVCLAWEGGGDIMRMITGGPQWTLAWSSQKTGCI